MGKVFISYSHEDVEWKIRLCKHLKVSNVKGPFTVWSDDELKLGDKYHKEIQQQIELADIAVLLVSVDFLSSDYVEKHELPPLKKRYDANDVRIIPVVIGDCDYENYWFTEALCLDNQNVISEQNREAALSKLAKEIRKLLEQPSGSLAANASASSTDDAQELPADVKDSSAVLEQNLISCGSQDIFKQKLLKSLVIAIKSADIKDLSATLGKYLELKPIADPDALLQAVAAELLKKGFHDAVPGPIHKTCQYFLSTDPSALEKRPDPLATIEWQRFTLAISKLMGLLALLELDEEAFQDQGRLQRVDGSYFIAQGISTQLGVELLLRRVDDLDLIAPDMQSSEKGAVELRGQVTIQKRSKDKWAKNSNVDHALIDIWNAVEDHTDPEGRFPRRSRNEKLDELAGDVEELNEKIAFYRGHESAPRCFFIAERLDNSEKLQELCRDLSMKLPALTAVGFKSQNSTTVFLQGDMRIKVAIESIYKTFGFCKQEGMEMKNGSTTEE